MMVGLLVVGAGCAPGVLSDNPASSPVGPMPVFPQPGSSLPAPPGPPTTLTTADQAKSSMSLWILEGPMTSVLQHTYQERHPEHPADYPVSFLRYEARNGGGQVVTFDLPYAGAAAVVELGKTGGAFLWNTQPSIQQYAAKRGKAVITVKASDLVRIDFSDMHFDDYEGSIVDLASGFVEGAVTTSCYKITTTTGDGQIVDCKGNPPSSTHHVEDPTWSSAFCAPLKP